MPPRLLGGPETPQEHVRTALTLLDELDRQLRGLGFILPEAYDLFGLLASVRGRLWLAVAILEASEPGEPR